MESIREITLTYSNDVLLVVVNKTISIQNIYARIGYYIDNEHFKRASIIPPTHISTFYKCTGITGDSHLFRIPIDKDKYISFVEILDGHSKAAHYLLLKVAQYHNPYCPEKHKYVEVIKRNEVQANKTDDFLNRVYSVSYDILGEENITQKQTDKACETIPIMTRQDDPVWVQGDSEISLVWCNKTHWENIYQNFGLCSNKTGWVVYDSYELISAMNTVAEDMLVKSICDLRLIQDDSNSICTPKPIALLSNEALQLVVIKVLKAIRNRPKRNTEIKRQCFGTGHVFMHISYEHLYNTEDFFHILKNDKLAKRVGISDAYLQHIRYIMGIEERKKHFYVQNGELLAHQPQLSSAKTVVRQLATLQQVQQFDDLYQEKMNGVIQEILDDIIFTISYEGGKMVITSDVLPEHTFLFSPPQDIEINIANRVVYIAETSPIIFSYVKLFRNNDIISK